ncbi:MAG TPA: glycosyltransferase [Actinomycetota bacterium]|nr:glycosyltransferase [Actinomycetota bacterium]
MKPQVVPLRLDPLQGDPLISVVMTNYNYDAFVDRAVQSVLEQTYPNWELIICDDGSADSSPGILRRLAGADSRIRLILQANAGQAGALNAAAMAAEGDLLCFLDSDDWWFPVKLEEVARCLRLEPEAGMVTHALRVVGLDERILRDAYPRRLSGGWAGRRLVDGDSSVVLPPCSALSMRREIATEVFPLPVAFRSLADRVLAERGASLAPVAALQKVLGCYRQHGRNVTGAGVAPTLEGVRLAKEEMRRILGDRAQFASDRHHVSVDLPALWRLECASLDFAEALLTGKQVAAGELERVRDRRQIAIWRLLLVMPRAIAIPVWKWWWSDGLLKRSLRRWLPASDR